MPIMNIVWPLLALYFGPLGVVVYLWLSGRWTAGRPQARPVMPQTPASAQAMDAMKPMHDGPMDGMSMPGHAMGPLWQRSLRSATHCMAGCALGDLVAMLMVAGAGWFGGAMWAETAIGSFLAFVFGLFIFQALPVMVERSIGFAAALSEALRADSISISAYLIGQIPAFYVLSALAPHAMGLTAPAFVLMQGAMAVGFVTTYPANYLLVVKGIKTGM